MVKEKEKKRFEDQIPKKKSPGLVIMTRVKKENFFHV